MFVSVCKQNKFSSLCDYRQTRSSSLCVVIKTGKPGITLSVLAERSGIANEKHSPDDHYKKYVRFIGMSTDVQELYPKYHFLKVREKEV